MDTIIEFCVFELVFVSNFTVDKQLWIFGQNLPTKGFSGLKQKKWKLPLNSGYSNYSRNQISAQTDSFDILDQIYPKKVFPVKKRKSEHHHGILHIWISVGTKFQRKLTIWVFGPNLPKKGYSKLQTLAFWVVKVNSTIVNSTFWRFQKSHYFVHFQIKIGCLLPPSLLLP